MIQALISHRPFFSIVMPVYNGEAFLSRAIESVLVQTDPDWEFVIVDDCSTDKTPWILNAYERQDSRIRIFRNECNLNIAPSLNRGIEAASGKWIVRLDADDYFNPEYLEKLKDHARMEKGEDCFVSSWISVVDAANRKILDIRLPEAGTIQRMMPYENFLYHPATSFPKALWKKLGGYPVKAKGGTVAEDTAMWLKFFNAGARLEVIPEFLVNYRVHDSNITSVNDARLLDAEADKRRSRASRQTREWRISLFLKQNMLTTARSEILTLANEQKRMSLKNLQYFLLTFLPESWVYFFMWELRPRARSFLKDVFGRKTRV